MPGLSGRSAGKAMEDLPKDLLSGLKVAEKIGSGLYGHIKTNRAHARSVAIELRQNIELIGLYAQAGSDAADVVPRLSNSALGTAITAGFNFASLKRAKIGNKSTRGRPQLDRYVGWSTQKGFERLYTRIATLKHAAEIDRRKQNSRIRVDVRLTNLFRYMIMLARHIEA